MFDRFGCCAHETSLRLKLFSILFFFFIQSGNNFTRVPCTVFIFQFLATQIQQYVYVFGIWAETFIETFLRLHQYNASNEPIQSDAFKFVFLPLVQMYGWIWTQVWTNFCKFVFKFQKHQLCVSWWYLGPVFFSFLLRFCCNVPFHSPLCYVSVSFTFRTEDLSSPQNLAFKPFHWTTLS